MHLISLLLITLFSLPALGLTEGEVEDGVKFYSACAGCHGAQAEGNSTVGAPRLAGQDADYLKYQLQGFRQGYRGTHSEDVQGQTMRAMALGLSDAQVEKLAIYLSALPSSLNSVSETQDHNESNTRGQGMYGGVCSACHGARAEGNSMLGAPRLNQLTSDYLIRQLKAYRQGWRGYHSEDRLGRQMRPMASLLTGEQQIQDVAAYIQRLGQQ